MAFGGDIVVGGNAGLSIQGGKLRTANPRFQQKVRSIDFIDLCSSCSIHPYVFADRFCGFTWTGWNDRSPCNQTSQPATDMLFEGVRQCHQRIYDQFSRTGMGRSMTQVTPALLETLPAKASFHQKNPDRILNFAQDGSYTRVNMSRCQREGNLSRHA